MGILAGEDAIHAKRSLAVLTSVKLSFANSEANWTEVGCSSCTPAQAFIDFQGLKTIYGQEYTCGDSNCIGACVAAIQVNVLFQHDYSKLIHRIVNLFFCIVGSFNIFCTLIAFDFARV